MLLAPTAFPDAEKRGADRRVGEFDQTIRLIGQFQVLLDAPKALQRIKIDLRLVVGKLQAHGWSAQVDCHGFAPGVIQYVSHQYSLPPGSGASRCSLKVSDGETADNRSSDRSYRFQSIQIVNQDHYSLATVYDPGTYTFTQEDVGARCVLGLIRTFVDANNLADVQRANVIQDQTAASQAAPGAFEAPDWDQEALARLRDALNVLAATLKSNEGSFGKPGEVDSAQAPALHRLRLGGNPLEDATYLNVVPELNDGTTPHAFTVTDVPVDGFWSITVYNKDGYLEPNDQHIYTYNNVTAAKNADGSITITFRRGADAVNNLPITPGWNYVVRLYRPRPVVLDGSWTFPEAMPVG